MKADEKLTALEKESSAWKKVSAMANERLRVNRIKLEGNLNEIETALVRGRIRELCELLALGEEPEPAMGHDRNAMQ
ncbi:hypothetical protein [Caudoviricetes sp.]|nr:hypothetical protein [Caudoviricetes sp.]